MRNFIQVNIDNVKKPKKGFSIQNQLSTPSPPKHHLQNNHPRQNSIHQRLAQLENRLETFQNNQQQEILDQLSTIKQDIRLIKSHMFEHKFSREDRQQTFESANEEEQNNYQSNQRMKSQSSDHEYKVVQKGNKIKTVSLQELINLRNKKNQSNYQRNTINMKTVTSMMKEYKLEGPQMGNIFYGYARKNSHPIVIKYSEEGLNSIIEIYDKFWKNIAQAKWTCVNRILDFKRQDSTIIVMERNKGNIVGLPPKPILIDILKILEFIHECGYLYRNIEPQHFMLNQDGQLVIIDFKRAKRFVDIKGHQLEIVDTFNSSIFASNNQVRGLPQSRKDDLESLGYFALLLLQFDIPWLGCSKEQIIKIRSNLTLQELYKGNHKWVEYMATVMKTPRNEKPDYKRLIEILQSA